MAEKIKTIARNKIAILPLLGAILIIISLFTPFAISEGWEGISISSQSNVWYWGIYHEQGQTEFLQMPFMLNVILSIIMLFFAILILTFSIEFGLGNLNKKLFGEAIAIFIALIFLSMTLTIKFIEYAFSLMPDQVTFMWKNVSFWAFRLESFGFFGIYIAIVLIVLGSIISLKASKKSFYYLEIVAFLIWIFSSFNSFAFSGHFSL